MSKQIQEQIESGKARIVGAPTNVAAVQIDRSFNLPGGLYAATVGCYLAFLGVLAVAFLNPVLVIPMVIFALFIVAGFGVPAIFTRLKGNDSEPMTMGEFERDGIMTNTGRLKPRDATIQVLILPVLIVAWAMAIAVIAAIVA